MHALAKDPGARYSTAAAFAVAITAARNAPDDVEGVAPTRTNADTSGGLGVIRTYSDDLVHAVTMPGPPPSSQQPSRPPSIVPIEEPPKKFWWVVWVVAVLAAIGVGVWLSLRN
jgi:hypothetical protein